MAEWNEGPDDLVVPFIFVPKGSPEPKEWLAQHPGAIRIPATLVPRTSATGGEDKRLHVDLDTVLTQALQGPGPQGAEPLPKTRHRTRVARTLPPTLSAKPSNPVADYLRVNAELDKLGLGHASAHRAKGRPHAAAPSKSGPGTSASEGTAGTSDKPYPSPERPAAPNTATDALQSSEQAGGRKALTNAQDATMSGPNLRPGAHGAPSHCSEATCQIARAVGANTTPLGPSSGGFYNANTQVQNLEKAANTPGSGWKKITLSEAQELGNKGALVVLGWKNPSGRSGHTVTVMSDPDNPRGSTNPTVAQVGGSTGNGRMPFRNAFGPGSRDHVEVFVYTGQ